MSTGTRALGWLPAFAGLLLGATVQAQESVPAFPTEAQVVTVDVVVLDKEGRPVRGLADRQGIGQIERAPLLDLW